MKAKQFTFAVDFSSMTDEAAKNIHTVCQQVLWQASQSLIHLRGDITVQPLQPQYDPEEWSMIDNHICGDRSEL